MSEENEQAKIIYECLKSKPIKEEPLSKILSSTTNSQRQVIRSCYKSAYISPIQIDLNESLSSKFKNLCINMFDTPYEYDARELHKALHSFLNDNDVINEIFVSRPYNYLKYVDKAYQNFYGISLKDEIKNETSGDYSKFLSEILKTERPVGITLKEEEAIEIAKDLETEDISLKDYGKNVDLFRNIFLEKSREDLILISRAYFDFNKMSFYDAIDYYLSGKNKALIKGILFATISPAEYFAKKIVEAVKGLVVDNDTLDRVVISRAEIDMKDIRNFYYIERNNDIIKEIREKTKGFYGDVLTALCQK